MGEKLKNLMIIDDEKSISNVLRFAFENDYNIYTANDLMEVNIVLKKTKPDIVLLDLKFGTVNGIEILEYIKSIYEYVEVIMMTAYGTIATSIEAIKKGAYDYILKPIDLDSVKVVVSKASENQDKRHKLTYEIDASSEGVNILGESPQIKKVFEKINRVKNVNVNVLIEGESGTGKELVARAIHFDGRRKSYPFIVVNCAAIPKNLIESELFGYEKGAFTGADKSKKGAFELANNGSIFLDEIGEMDLYCQSKVLRAIQNKEITPLGASTTKKINTRIIAATNKDLKQECLEGRFRTDLYYRLNVFPIKINPLNERIDDIPILVNNFIGKANKMYDMDIKGITQGAIDELLNSQYAGNVRELENIIYRACILCDNGYIDENCIQRDDEKTDHSIINDFVSVRLGSSLYDIEKQIILSTLKYVNGNKARAAKLLGISERNIHYKTRSYMEEYNREYEI